MMLTIVRPKHLLLQKTGAEVHRRKGQDHLLVTENTLNSTEESHQDRNPIGADIMNQKGDVALLHLANMTTDIGNTVDHRRINVKLPIEVTLTTANRKREGADRLIETAIPNTKTIGNEVGLLIRGRGISRRAVKNVENIAGHHRNTEARRTIKGDQYHPIKYHLILVHPGLSTSRCRLIYGL